jgi:type IV pilus assembly protein PilY1
VPGVRTHTNTPHDSTYSRSEYIVTAATPAACGNSNNRFNLRTNRQTGTQSNPFVTSLIEDVTTSTTTTITNRDGIITTTTSPTTTTRSTVSNNSSTPTVAAIAWTTTSTQNSTCLRASDLDNSSNNVVPTSNIQLSPFAYGSTPNRTSGPTTRTGSTLAPVTLSSSNLPGTPVTTTSTANGDSNSLADVAEYYYKTDLRTDIPNNVKPTTRDTATWQHMTTYTIGLGVRGSLDFDPNYLTGTPSGDYAALINGTKNWPVPTGTVTAGDYDATHVDDLWHTAVNGRGQYFSATNAGALSNAISSALKDVSAARGTAAAAASSTLTPSATDDWLFLTRYESSPTWRGDLKAFKFTFTDTGDLIQPDTINGRPVFSVASKLDGRDLVNQPRRILFNSSGTLTEFTYANLNATQKATFDNRCTTASVLLTQCGSIGANTAKVTGTNLVNFVRGDQTLLLTDLTPANQVWRARSNRLGDIVHSSPVYVAKPGFKYTDAGYAAFVAARANRTKVVYAGSNDGMLHAFKVAENTDNTAGDELWAFVPSAVIPELWRLADSDFDNNHRYYVDATANIADVFDGSIWRTVLVSGLGGGGRSYFALDITDPAAPTVLWEFTDTNLGLTYGNPVVTKNKAGTWVVAFSSGYNNVSPGDGVGRLYVVNAVTGALISTVSTGVGDTTTPSNLGRLNAWVDKDTNNNALRFYGGDMLGNMWRFDFDDLWPPSGVEAVLLGVATTPGGSVQPITSKPVLSEISVGGNKVALVSFGTGRYLGNNDLTDSTRQTIYSVKDSLLATGVGTLRSPTAKLVRRFLDADRKLTNPQPIDWPAQNGWFVDLDSVTRSDRERVYLDGTPLSSGVIGFASTVPNGDPCSAGGESWLYEFDVQGGLVTQVTHYGTTIVGLGRVETVTGVQGLVTTVDGLGDPPPRSNSVLPPPSLVKRTSWRELQD